MSLFPVEVRNTIYLSRTDANELLGTFARYSFELEGKQWPSVEHYFQGMKFPDSDYQETIRNAATPKQARALGRKKKALLRADWKKVRETIMTRAVYTRCKTYPPIAQALLDTGDKLILENSGYDYFWGCGRDRRGNNAYGRVLMNVRKKLLEEQAQSQT